MDFTTAEKLLSICEEEKIPISEAMLRRETTVLGSSKESVYRQMAHSYQIMKDAVKLPLEKPLKSIGGLIGGEASKIFARQKKSASVCGPIMSKALIYALGVLEVNSSMGLIVAAPTAGSSGVIPGTFLAIQEEYELSDDEMIKGLYNASAIGYLITRNATVAGAEGGCQAEVGSASAMAAAAITEIMGGTPRQALTAASIALTNLMGLICDPIAGLVEAPCQNRNGIGAANALICAEIALSDIESTVPFDETVAAMYRVGQSMPLELRETALGGIAATPTGCTLCTRVLQSKF